MGLCTYNFNYSRFSIEFIQYTIIPSRSGKWLDVQLNSLGLISMLSLTYVLKKISVL